MQELSAYPISFPYGVTTAPYTVSHPHRGDDRAAPLNTPIIIKGVTIGFVGMTGFATGYHCHNQEWQGSKTNVRKPQNAFKGGTVIEVDAVGNTGDGSFGKYVTLRNDDGWNTSYCHMNSVNATVGQIIKQEEGVVVDMPITPTQVDKVIKMGLHRPATDAELNNPDKQTNPGLLIDQVWASGGEQEYNASQTPPPTGFKPYAGPALYEEA
jgi:hypothetical protein